MNKYRFLGFVLILVSAATFILMMYNIYIPVLTIPFVFLSVSVLGFILAFKKKKHSKSIKTG